MKIGPAVAADVLDDRPAFVIARRDDGGLAALCGYCAAKLPLRDGWGETHELKHEPGCALGHVLAEVWKPIFLRFGPGEVKH